MKKRMLLIVLIMSVLCAVGVNAVVVGTSTDITRHVYLPTEDNVNIQAQEELTIMSIERLDSLEANINSMQQDVGSLRAGFENQKSDIATRLGGITRELSGITQNVNELQVIRQQLVEIKPQLEKPLAVIPPISLLILGAANMLLLIVVIIMIFWLKGQHLSLKKESHIEEHALIHLTSYIANAVQRGISMRTIRKRLVDKGWSESKVDEAVQEVRAMM